MPSPPRDQLPQTPGEWWFYGVFSAAIVGMFAAVIFADFSIAKLTAVFFVVAWMPLLAVHELGHAIAARAVGWHVGRIVLGFGPPLGRFQWGAARVELRAFPLEGFVQCVPGDLVWPRAKNALVYFAGPGVELLVAGGVVMLVGAEALFSPAASVATAAWQGLCVAALTGAIVNLIPHGAELSTGERVANDGLGILQSCFLPLEYFERMRNAYDPLTGEWKEDHDE